MDWPDEAAAAVDGLFLLDDSDFENYRVVVAAVQVDVHYYLADQCTVCYDLDVAGDLHYYAPVAAADDDDDLHSAHDGNGFVVVVVVVVVVDDGFVVVDNVYYPELDYDVTGVVVVVVVVEAGVEEEEDD